MSKSLHLAIVVSTPGNMARRAEALVAAFPQDVRSAIAVRPTPLRARDLARASDVVYVIDAGRYGFAAGVVGWLTRRPVVFELGDPQAPLYRVQRRSRVAVAAGASIDRLVSTRAAGVAVRGRELAEILDVRVPWIVLPDGVDTTRFVPPRDDASREALGFAPDQLVVGTVGTVGVSRKPGLGYGWDVVESLRHVADERVVGLVVGDGPGLESLRSYAGSTGLGDRVRFTGRVLHDEVPAFMGAIDVCVSTQTNDAVGRARTTAKLPEYLACDRFVLATAVGAAADLLPHEMLVPYDGSWDATYPVRLGERLADLVHRRRELRHGVGTRRLAESHFAYPLLARRLAAFLREVSS